MTELFDHPTDSSWTFRWRSPLGMHELAYVVARERWLRRFRHVDQRTAELAAWTNPQPVALPAPDDEDQARAIAQRFAEEKT